MSRTYHSRKPGGPRGWASAVARDADLQEARERFNSAASLIWCDECREPKNIDSTFLEGEHAICHECLAEHLCEFCGENIDPEGDPVPLDATKRVGGFLCGRCLMVGTEDES